ncbi:MAG: hypothetical protein QOD98_694, partial [Nocardioidaceae bacterium]|nr:hypothetical protein [Nocardioidaceae bacterium]
DVAAADHHDPAAGEPQAGWVGSGVVHRTIIPVAGTGPVAWDQSADYVSREHRPEKEPR